MKIFSKEYAKVYDLLYKDKNYRKESHAITKLIKKHKKNSSSILDLGCGTGKYTSSLFKNKFDVTGVDRSEAMLKIAKAKNKKITFVKSDITKIKLNQKFDVITTMFDVLSYLNTNKDINIFFQKANIHLKNKGLIFFDFWYKPGIEKNKPLPRLKKIENSKFKIFRMTNPKWHQSKNIIEVNSELVILNKVKKTAIDIKEKHNLRYFSLQEIKSFLKKFDFNIITTLELPTGKKISNNCWSILVLAKKN
tara:strand:+ start:256 stop:1005 length:750 start_codon:yes stop_codon:yes gene_type:complete